MPLLNPTVATVIVLLDQIPPPVLQASAMVDPSHIVEGPVIAAGTAFTVTDLVEMHPVANV
jgi:hypothetical protein